MHDRLGLAFCCSLVVASQAATLADAPHQSPLHGQLVPGPHRVGFMRIAVSDPLRPTGPDRVAGAAVTHESRARHIEVQVWYPAAGGAARSRPLTVADYLALELDESLDATTRAVRSRERVDRFKRQLGSFGTVADDAFARLLASPFLAEPDSEPAPGRFPLIVGQLRPFATTLTSEHLASHGYVVAMVAGDSPEEVDAGRGLEVAVRDMEVAIAELRSRPFVDPAALGALGFSGAGFSQLLLAMRHPDVDAVCDLESAIFDAGVMWPLHRGWGYDVAALRVPFLHTYSVPLSRRENRFADFEAMRYATRYHYLVDAPGITHADFATDGMLASLVPGLRGDQAPRLQLAFETTNRYVRAFFDAHVKGDPEGLAFLTTPPERHGVADGLITVRVLPAIAPAPTADAFRETIARDGLAEAMQVFNAARARDPEATLFLEGTLNSLGYRFFREERYPEALALLRAAVEFYPASPNTYDSLSEVLAAAGERDEALAIARRGVVVASAPGVSPGVRDAFVRMLQERITRLGQRP